MSGALVRLAGKMLVKVAKKALATLGPPMKRAFNAAWRKARKLLGKEKKAECTKCEAQKYHDISDEELRKKNIEALEKLKKDMGVTSKTATRNKIGPAHAIAHNRRNGKTYTAINDPEGDLPQPTNPYIEERVYSLRNNEKDVLESYREYTHGEGSHAEVNAVNEALNDDPGAVKSDITVDVIRTGSTREPAGDPFKQCPHCESILRGIRSPSQPK